MRIIRSDLFERDVTVLGRVQPPADRKVPDFDQTRIAKRPCIAAGPCAVWCRTHYRN